MPPWPRCFFRRFTEYEKSKQSGEGFGRLPDLILLDGGAGAAFGREKGYE